MENSIDNLDKMLDKGVLENELEFERASIIDRGLMLLSKKHPELNDKRKKLLQILTEYESRVWVNSEITHKKFEESDLAEAIAEQERVFLHKRKEIIKQRLKSLSLSQKDFGKILGHTSVSYISELVSGINPFTMHDLVIIHLLLEISFQDLIPTILGTEERMKITDTIQNLGHPKIKLNEQSLALMLSN